MVLPNFAMRCSAGFLSARRKQKLKQGTSSVDKEAVCNYPLKYLCLHSHLSKKNKEDCW